MTLHLALNEKRELWESGSEGRASYSNLLFKYQNRPRKLYKEFRELLSSIVSSLTGSFMGTASRDHATLKKRDHFLKSSPFFKFSSDPDSDIESACNHFFSLAKMNYDFKMTKREMLLRVSFYFKLSF
jgi:hypothetical protein